MSSRFSQSKELGRSVKVQHALDRLGTSSTVGRKHKAEVVTHRCRIYRLDSKAIREGTSVYTVVWDTLERPFKGKALPQGEVYYATSGSSPSAVKEEVECFCQRLGRVVITDWHAAGSF